MSEKIQEIKKRCARISPSNWQEVAHDIGILLSEVERLEARRILIEHKTDAQIPGVVTKISIVDADDPRLSKNLPARDAGTTTAE